MFTLALTALNAARLHQLDIRADRKNALEFIAQMLLHRKHPADIIAEIIPADFYLHLDGI